MPSHYIGFDFGTTNSIVSYFDGDRLDVLQYGSQHEKYIPSFIAYHEDDFIEIGIAAKSEAANNPSLEAYGNFKMRLPIAEQEFSQHFRDGRTPMTVTTDYLQELLIAQDSESFVKQHGEIAGIVVSVPEIWQRDICNTGRERLQEILKEKLGLGDRLIQLVSEPVAAAAYYAWEINERSQDKSQGNFTGNVLVCDMGGGTFDVSLCRISGDNKIEVLYFDGQGDRGLESAGVAFDRRCVQIAYRKTHNGQDANENSTEFRGLLKEFETVKVSNARATAKLTNYLKDPDTFADQTLYTFAGSYNVTCREVEDAFMAISAGIEQVMQKVKGWLADNNTSFDRLFLVGGFSQFFLVRESIFKALNVDKDDPRVENSFNIRDSTFAISYGACLIANGKIDPIEKYSHDLGIVLDVWKADASKEERYVSIVRSGTSINDLISPCFADIPPVFAFRQDEPLNLQLWIDPRGSGRKIKDTLPDMVKLPGSWSESHQWRIGMRVNRSQIAYLVVEEMNNKHLRAEYELGNVLAKMFSGFVLIE